MTSLVGAQEGTTGAGGDRTHALGDRLDGAAWGLLFLLLGAMALPSGTTEYAAVAAAGALLVGLNGLRAIAHIEIGWLSVVLGTTALIAGVGALAGIRIDDVALFFALIGVVLIGGAIAGPRVRPPSAG